MSELKIIIRCNHCMEIFDSEDDLEILEETDNETEINGFYKGCPNCKTDETLMDIELSGIKISIGDIVSIRYTYIPEPIYYIIALVKRNKIKLIGLSSGSRFKESLKVKDPLDISEYEFGMYIGTHCHWNIVDKETVFTKNVVGKK